MTLGQTSQSGIAVDSETIVALGTAPGRGAIAVVRMSGDRAIEIAARHITPWPTEARVTRLCTVHHGSKALDQAIVTFYVAPASFTGENTVELFTHGGYVVPTSVMAAFIDSGAREALPGEFTRRAVLNGKLDIVQAEAIGDLVDARSSAMQQTALYQLDGGLSSRVTSVREGILGVESLIAYDLDFPEEDDGSISTTRIIEAADVLLESLDLLLSTIPLGQIVRGGAIVVIAGEPNTGKSSLFNALVGEARAIVTEISGTTRDAIEAVVEMNRWPIRLIDTAGLRHSDDIVERLGIEMSERHVSAAHLVIACGDTEESLERTVAVISSLSTASLVPVLTKSDLWASTGFGTQGSDCSSASISVSAVTGEGFDRLRSEIELVLDRKYGDITPETPILTRAWHIHGIQRARDEVQQFRNIWEGDLFPASIAAVHLRSAAVALEGLIGAISADDVLNRVFSSFCVGK